MNTAWISIILLVMSSLLFSGSLFKHRRMLTWLATAGIIWEAQWLLLTLIQRLVNSHWPWPGSFIVLIGSVILLTISIFYRQQWFWPYQQEGSGIRDVAVLVVLLIVLGASWLITQRNGIQGTDFVWHGFYNGDTATFIALVQKSLLSNQLVDTNPFAGNGPLEYPTLLHAGVANLLNSFHIGVDWLRFLPLLTYVQIFLTIPIFFLLFDVVIPEPAAPGMPWLGIRRPGLVLTGQALIILFVLGLSWDNYVYPQSHFFLTGSFLVLCALLSLAYNRTGRSQSFVIIPASILTLVLLLSNAVTGTAALALTTLFCLLRLADPARPALERQLFGVGVVVWPVIFLLATPGQSSLGLHPHFSYTAAADMVRFLPILLAIVSIALLNLSKKPWQAAGITILTLLSLVTFVFSSRDIVVDNAGRFLYHALLLGFPLLLVSVITCWYWLRQQLLLNSHTWIERLGGWALVFGMVALVGLPAAASVASAHDHLIFQDEHHISGALRTALWWVDDNTPANSIFIASPYSPWAVPILTGRSLLRTDYWLSPADNTLIDLKAAFRGDQGAQARIANQADYLLLAANERALWEPLPVQKVFDNQAYVIYKLHK